MFLRINITKEPITFKVIKVEKTKIFKNSLYQIEELLGVNIQTSTSSN